MATSYHDRPEWSYSQMKAILDSGIDYAVAAKRGMLPGPASKSIDLGQLVHMFVLGGDPSTFVVPEYVDFRTKEARAWRDEMQSTGKTIISRSQYEAVSPIVDNIEGHPMSKELLKGNEVKHEVELFAKVNRVALRGKADAILNANDKLTICDIKTTAQFDGWKYAAMSRHYDLQAAVYSLIAAKSLGVSPLSVDFYFCVAETVAPYRVQYHYSGTAFVEHGEQKLVKCLEEITKFGDREPNFLIEEVNELGDWSI